MKLPPQHGLHEPLEEALGSGPFDVALRLAIRASGLSLDRLQRRLREHGVSVSRTTLSYWQSGRTQPERADSLRAVGVLEQVLCVPAGSLSDLLGPPRPRGRWLAQGADRFAAGHAWARQDGLLRALAQIQAEPDSLSALTQVRLTALVRLDAHRQIRTMAVQVVLRATRPEVGRALMVQRHYMAGIPAPQVARSRGCRAGRVGIDPVSGFAVYEMILDRLLPEGAMTMADYTLHYPPGHLDPYSAHRVGAGVRELSLQVEFEQVMPARCHAFYRPSNVEPRSVTEELWIGGPGTVAHVVCDPEPGIHGVGWEWA